MARAAWALLVIGTCVAFAGCSQLAGERVIAADAVRDALQSQLGVSLVQTPTVDSVPSFGDLAASYVLRARGERMLVLVFDSGPATVQVTGAKAPGARVVVVHNVVVIYEAKSGVVSRLPELQAVLRGLDSAAAA